MKAVLPVFLFLVFGVVDLFGQIGGNNTYAFLNLPNSARVAALGGSLITAADGDVSLAYDNPSILTVENDLDLSFQHRFIAAGIQSGYAGFAKWIESAGITGHVGFKYVLYGEFDHTDEFGNLLGNFKGSEVAINVGAGYVLYENLQLGANVKFISSQLEVYRSSALAFDLSALYRDTTGLFTAAMSLKNLGFQISRYDTEQESLPVDLQVGLAKRLRHLPFQISVIYHHLNHYNLLYDDPNSEEGGFTGGFQPVGSSPSKVDNFFRHFIFGGELYIGKSEVVTVRLGYNHQLKQELSVNNLRTLTGFSFGLGLKTRKFRFDYGFNKLHFGASSHYLGISTNLKSFSSQQLLN